MDTDDPIENEAAEFFLAGDDDCGQWEDPHHVYVMVLFFAAVAVVLTLGWILFAVTRGAQ